MTKEQNKHPEKRLLEIIDKPHFGVRVVNPSGDAELGNWHIADFSWREHAELFVKAWELKYAK